jgi:hypothetical protein
VYRRPDEPLLALGVSALKDEHDGIRLPIDDSDHLVRKPPPPFAAMRSGEPCPHRQCRIEQQTPLQAHCSRFPCSGIWISMPSCSRSWRSSPWMFLSDGGFTTPRRTEKAKHAPDRPRGMDPGRGSPPSCRRSWSARRQRRPRRRAGTRRDERVHQPRPEEGGPSTVFRTPARVVQPSRSHGGPPNSVKRWDGARRHRATRQ